jgi:hypothetical protein
LEKGEFEGIPVNSASKIHYLGTFQNLVWTVWLQNWMTCRFTDKEVRFEATNVSFLRKKW